MHGYKLYNLPSNIIIYYYNIIINNIVISWSQVCVTVKLCQFVKSSPFNNENILKRVCTLTIYSLVIWLTFLPRLLPEFSSEASQHFFTFL